MEIDKSELITEPLPKPLESEYVRTLIKEVCYCLKKNETTKETFKISIVKKKHF